MSETTDLTWMGDEDFDPSKFSDEQLLKALASGLRLTARILIWYGQIWVELERRGHNLEHLRKGVWRWMPLIGAGQLAAEAVIAFAPQPGVLNRIRGMPLDQQKRLAAGEPIKVIDGAAQGGVTEMPLSKVPANVLRIVVEDGRVRSPEEQRREFQPAVQLPSPPTSPPRPTERVFHPRFNPETGRLRIGTMEVLLEEVVSALAGAAGPDVPPLEDQPQQFIHKKVNLWPSEAEDLAAYARRTGQSESVAIRAALRAFGIFRAKFEQRET